MNRLFTLVLLIISLTSFAQNAITLTGKVNDESNNSPVELAAVVLKTADSVYVADVFTNTVGQFAFTKVPSGKFYVEISFLGYEKYFSKYMEIKSSMEIPLIKLKKSENTIKEVNITATKNALEFKPGKTVYTVGRDQTNAGLDGLEVLKKIPGVFVDNNDNITVRGKSGIRVYIDDRPSALAVESPAEAIKFFPAGSIESIEVITNPSAKYDAAGAGAIINIKLKKEKKLGMNGNMSIGAGSRYEFTGVNKFNGGFNANIRRNKTNVFINASSRMDERQSYNENHRVSANGQSLDSYTNGLNNSMNVFVKAGVDYFINDKNTFGISYLISTSQYKNNTKSISNNTYDSTFHFPASNSNSLNKGNFTSHTVNLNYIFKTKHAGEEFSFDVTHSILSRNNIDTINTSYMIPNFPLLSQFTDIKGNVQTNSSQVDYTRTLKGEAKIEAGLKNSYTSNTSKFNFFNNEGQSWRLDSAQSNKFDYFENISAAYSQYSNKYKKWEYLLGLRAEYTIVKSNLSDVNQHYLNFFPDLQASKKFEEGRELSFSYSSRIDRVPFSELNTAVSYTDKYVGQRGNPKLQPEISNVFSVDFQKQFDGSKDFKLGTIGLSVYGSVNKNAVGYAVVIDTGNTTFVTYTNILHTWSYGGNAYVQLSYLHWYNATLNVAGNYQYFNPENKGVVYNLYAQNVFKFLKKHSVNVNGFYFTKFLTSQGYLKGTYQVNLGYKYLFWKETGSLSLNVSDIFKTGKYRYYVTTQGYNVNGIFQFESRFAYLTFTYKFSKGWQGDGKKRTKKNVKDTRNDYNNSGSGGLGNGK
jgi:iron complex outermembrane receptor protein